MDQNSLVNEEKEAGMELIRQFQSYHPIEVAFWIKWIDNSDWTFCIASKEVDEPTFRETYGHLLELSRWMHNCHIDPFNVRLLQGTDPLALAARKILERHPGGFTTRLSENEFGNMLVERAYIYPKSLVSSLQAG